MANIVHKERKCVRSFQVRESTLWHVLQLISEWDVKVSHNYMLVHFEF